MLLTTAGAKFCVAGLQLSASILYIRSLGAIQFGEIASTVALAELALLLTLPGIQKSCLRSFSNQIFPQFEYIAKVVLSVFVFSVLNWMYGGSWGCIEITLTVCVFVDGLLALNRAALHAAERFLLFVILDGLRPVIAIVAVSSAYLWSYPIGKELFIYVVIISIVIEVCLVAPYVKRAMQCYNWGGASKKSGVSSAIKASGFAYCSTPLRKLPIVAAKSISPELVSLVVIFLQFFTLINYLVSAFMLQASILLLKKRLIVSSVLDLLGMLQKKVLAGCILGYIGILGLVDWSQFYWLSIIYNVEGVLAESIFTFGMLPLVTLYAQLLFYNLFSKSDDISGIYIYILIGQAALIALLFLIFFSSVQFSTAVSLYYMVFLLSLICVDVSFQNRRVNPI